MSSFGAFGKVPALGDFVRLGLPQSFIAAWDPWLQKILVGAREMLGERWRECYFSSPIWRFSLPAGLAGPAGMIGVLMPSVDRVGRHYPLTLASAAPAGSPLLHRHLSAGPTFAALEVIALAALEHAATTERLAADLASVSLPTPPPPPARLTEPGRITLVTGDGAIEAALAATCPLLDGAMASIWTSRVAACSRLLAVDGLPDTEVACGLFDGDATLWGRDGRVGSA